MAATSTDETPIDTGADVKWLRWAQSRFEAIAGKDTDIDRESFKNALEVANVFFANRVFDLADTDNSGTVSLQEMMDILRLLNQGTHEEKIKFYFDVYDVNEDGTIDLAELRTLLKTGADESSMQLSEEKLEHLTNTLFTSADVDQSGAVSFDEFIGVLKGYPDLMNNLSLSAASGLRSTRKNKRDLKSLLPKPGYFRNNFRWILFKVIFVLINAALFAEAAHRHSKTPHANWAFLIARGCGQALNFSSSIVVVLMLRTTLSFLRATWLNYVLPFDEAIALHKTIGHAIVILAVSHTAGHIGNAVIRDNNMSLDATAAQLLFTANVTDLGLRVGRLQGSAFITGWLLLICLFILLVGSMTFIRRSGHFQIFFWTHKFCYLIFWFLLILHGPRFWCWFLGPAVLFTLEKISQMKIVRFIRFGKTYVKEANLLPSGVTHLVLTRPRTFKYKCGDYIFIQIPVIAKHEWHPFTISSAPEQEDICLHIRSAGNWTKSLYRYFNEQKLNMIPRKSLTERAASLLRRRGSRYASRRKGNKGEVNAGFELDGDAARAGGQPGQVVGQTVVAMPEDSDSYNYSDDEEVMPPPMLSIKRLSYAPEVSQSAMSRLKMMAANQTSIEEVLEEEAEEAAEKEEETEDEKEKDGGKEEKEEDENEKEEVEVEKENEATDDREEESRDKPEADVDESTVKSTNQIQTIFNLNTNKLVQVHIQGPYGTPSTAIFQSEHAVLIGAGIGVTPFASIIQSIMCRQRSLINKCPNCQNSWVDEERSRLAFRVKKVDFVWLNRNHTAFEWFVDLLLGLEQQQSQYSLDRFLDLHLYMTGIKRFDMKNVGIQMALDMVHEKEQKDMLTGLRTKLQTGRPDWAKLFAKIKEDKKGRVSVFFCGAPALGDTLNKYCRQFGFRFHKENF